MFYISKSKGFVSKNHDLNYAGQNWGYPTTWQRLKRLDKDLLFSAKHRICRIESMSSQWSILGNHLGLPRKVPVIFNLLTGFEFYVSKLCSHDGLFL